ncbi:MAG: MFS transporter [Candidatus Pacebacteria bacterium]|nr:MFS transporter [Candidatus Paceibacterota bacterium]
MPNSFLNRFLKHNTRHEITELYISVAIKNFAFSMIAIFEPLYLYKLYDSISMVFLYYAVVYTLHFFLVPFGAKAAAKYGFEHCIFYSIPFAILYFLALSQIPNYGWMIFAAIIFVVIHRIMFWPSYHTDFAHYSILGFKGREMSAMSSISIAATVIGPIIGGIILTKFGFEALFVIVSIASLISIIPLFATKEKFEPHDFSYKKAFRRLLKPYGRYKRKNLVAYFAFSEETVLIIGWPIFIFFILKEFYLIGILMGVSALLIAIINLYAGKLSDRYSTEKREKLLSSSASLYSIFCFLRPFVGGWVGILSVDFLSKIAKMGIKYPIFTFIYNGGGRRKDFLEYIIFYELSLSLGRIIIIWFVFFLSLYLSGFVFWFTIFTLSGLWAFLFKSAKFE